MSDYSDKLAAETESVETDLVLSVCSVKEAIAKLRVPNEYLEAVIACSRVSVAMVRMITIAVNAIVASQDESNSTSIAELRGVKLTP